MSRSTDTSPTGHPSDAATVGWRCSTARGSVIRCCDLDNFGRDPLQLGASGLDEYDEIRSCAAGAQHDEAATSGPDDGSADSLACGEVVGSAVCCSEPDGLQCFRIAEVDDVRDVYR